MARIVTKYCCGHSETREYDKRTAEYRHISSAVKACGVKTVPYLCYDCKQIASREILNHTPHDTLVDLILNYVSYGEIVNFLSTGRD